MRTIGEYIGAIVPRDSESNVPVEYCVIFALIAIFIGLRGFAGSGNHPAFSAVAVTIPGLPLRPVSSAGAQIDTSSGSDVSVVGNPAMADSGLARIATPPPGLGAHSTQVNGQCCLFACFDRKTPYGSGKPIIIRAREEAGSGRRSGNQK